MSESAGPASPDPAATVTALLVRCAFPPPGTPVTCAVSGGPDSIALLVLAVASGCRAEAIHVDHGLRDGSAAEFAVVRAAADTLGVPARSVAVAVGAGPNLEARARAARYAAMPAGVLTGHTADDQAETVLLNLLRGAGLDGLAGMRATAPAHLPQRPMLGLRRRETRAVCELMGLDVVDDPSNTDRRFLRNRVRHELIGLLDDLAGRDVTPVLARQAALIADEAELLDELAGSLDPSDARALAAAPPALARRAVRRWLGGDGHPPDAATVQRVLDVAHGRAVACEIGGGRRVRRSHQRLVLDDAASGRTIPNGVV